MAMFLLGRIYAPSDPEVSFTGKTIIVTGSNTGLGLATASKLIKKDAQKVILAVRTPSKGNAAKKEIVLQHGHEDRLEVWELDMNDYMSIRRFADRANTLDRLDVALLNAGVYTTEYKTSAYSWEEALQVNTLSTTLLAILLLPKLQQSRTTDSIPVLEFTNSGTHQRFNPSTIKEASDILSTCNEKKRFNPSNQYASSKLLLMFAAQVLSDKVNSSSTLIDSVCPGACRSDLARGYNSFFMQSIAKPLIFTIFRTSEQGARTLVSGTTLGPEAHGRFWQHDKLQPKIPVLEDKKLQDKIWTEIIEAIRKDYPDIDKALEQITTD